jgi:hypothetical protein
MKTFVYLIVSAGLVVLATACRSTSAMPDNSKSGEIPLLSTPILVSATDEPAVPPTANTPAPIVQQKMVDLSRENLSQMLNVNMDQIVTVKVEPAVWPDASLGCPKVGVAYIQVLTPGFVARLEAEGQQYLYHTDESEAVILCTRDTLPVFPVTPGDIQDGMPWVPAN